MSQTDLKWYHFVALFFGGAFLSNAIPHLVAGMSGSPFQSPFASPPGEGLSSAPINAAWGLINLVIGYLLLVRTGRFDLRRTRDALVFAAGFAGMAIMLARHFGRFHGGLL